MKKFQRNEEWYKLKEVLITLRDEFKDILISIDTYRSEIAEKSINNKQILLTIFHGDLDKKMFSVTLQNTIYHIS